MSDELTPEDVEAIVLEAVAELLNLAATVAELQTTDDAAEEIYQVCDLVAEYYQIERSRPITEEHEDGSFTTRFEPYVGAEIPLEDSRNNSAPGVIRTKGKPKLRLVDKNTPPDTTSE